MALNYLPVLMGGILLVLELLITANVRNLVVALAASLAWLVFAEEVLGRRPYVRRVGNEIEIRNILRVQTVRADSITGVKLHTFRMGKDTCPAIRMSDRAIPVMAYFGSDLNLVGSELGVPGSGGGRRRGVIGRLRKRERPG